MTQPVTHWQGGAALAAVTHPSDALGQQCIAIADALAQATAAAASRGAPPVSPGNFGDFFDVVMSHARTFASAYATQLARSGPPPAALLASYTTVFNEATAMLSAVNRGAPGFDTTQATRDAMVSALNSAAAAQVSPDVAAALGNMASLVLAAWAPGLANAPLPSTLSVVVGDEAQLAQLMARVQRWIDFLNAGG